MPHIDGMSARESRPLSSPRPTRPSGAALLTGLEKCEPNRSHHELLIFESRPPTTGFFDSTLELQNLMGVKCPHEDPQDLLSHDSRCIRESSGVEACNRKRASEVAPRSFMEYPIRRRCRRYVRRNTRYGRFGLSEGQGCRRRDFRSASGQRPVTLFPNTARYAGRVLCRSQPNKIVVTGL